MADTERTWGKCGTPGSGLAPDAGPGSGLRTPRKPRGPRSGPNGAGNTLARGVPPGSRVQPGVATVPHVAQLHAAAATNAAGDLAGSFETPSAVKQRKERSFFL